MHCQSFPQACKTTTHDAAIVVPDITSRSRDRDKHAQPSQLVQKAGCSVSSDRPLRRCPGRDVRVRGILRGRRICSPSIGYGDLMRNCNPFCRTSRRGTLAGATLWEPMRAYLAESRVSLMPMPLSLPTSKTESKTWSLVTTRQDQLR